MAVAALALAASPLSAQEAPEEIRINTTPTSNSSADAIGPRELENFSLDGRVTRESEPATAAQPPATTASRPADAEPRPAPAQADSRPAATGESRTAFATRTAAADRAADILSRRPTPSGAARSAATTVAATTAQAFPDIPSSPTIVPEEGGFSPLPWIAALLFLGAGAAVYFGRQGRAPRYAASGHAPSLNFAPQPQPRPQPAPRAPAPRPAPQPSPSPAGRAKPPTTLIPKPKSPEATPATAGVVSTSLRPWLEVEFTPIQAAVNDDHAAIAFEVTLFNSGSAPARDVAIEACLFNAGNQQDKALSEFYATPADGKDTIPLIAPFSRISLKSAVRLNRDAVHEYQVEGRKLFMPMAAVSARYRWSSGEGQSGVSFLVGRGSDDKEKLGPLRLDKGARQWKGLGARRYEKGIRR